MSFNLNANIDFNKTCVPLKRYDHAGVTVKYEIEIPCTWTMPPLHYPKFSMSTLLIWVLKSGVLKNAFILCEHGTKANIGDTKDVNRNFLQSYLTSVGLSLYSSQPDCEKTHQSQHRERLAKIRKTTCTVGAWRHLALHRLVRPMPFATSPVLKR
jgi:hypothetical protein